MGWFLQLSEIRANVAPPAKPTAWEQISKQTNLMAHTVCQPHMCSRHANLQDFKPGINNQCQKANVPLCKNARH